MCRCQMRDGSVFKTSLQSQLVDLPLEGQHLGGWSYLKRKKKVNILYIKSTENPTKQKPTIIDFLIFG